jgi:hypothetical protein
LSSRSPGAWVLPVTRRQILQRWDGGHALGGEHAAALQLPVLVLLQQHSSHQAGDGGVVGEDAEDAGAAFDLLIDPLQQVGAPDRNRSRGVPT